MEQYLGLAFIAAAIFFLGQLRGEDKQKKESSKKSNNLTNEFSPINQNENKITTQFEDFKTMSDDEKIEYLNNKLSKPTQFKIDFETMIFFAQNYGDKININKNDELNTFTINVIEDFKKDRETYFADVNNPSRQIIKFSQEQYELQKKRFTISNGMFNIYGTELENTNLVNLYFDERFNTEWHTSTVSTKFIKISNNVLVEMTEHQIIKNENSQNRFIRTWQEFSSDINNPEYYFLREQLAKDIQSKKVSNINNETQVEKEMQNNISKFNISDGVQKYE